MGQQGCQFANFTPAILKQTYFLLPYNPQKTSDLLIVFHILIGNHQTQ